MITVGNYIKVILKKRNMTQKDLLDKMNKLKLGNDIELNKQHLNNAINLKMTYIWARRIEIALELPQYSLVRMVGKPTQLQWKKIEEVKPNA